MHALAENIHDAHIIAGIRMGHKPETCQVNAQISFAEYGLHAKRWHLFYL